MTQKLVKSKKSTKSRTANGRGLSALVTQVEQSLQRPDIKNMRAGDTVRVHVRIKEGDKERVQVYEGIVMTRSSRNGCGSYTVRKISHGVGVERIFMETSPKVAKVEIVLKGKVRRAKLYYLRGLEGKAAKLDSEVVGTTSSA